MEYSNAIKKILSKENSTYEELQKIILDSIKEVEPEVWEIEINTLNFPVVLNENEMFEFIEFFFLQEYDEAAYVNIYSNEGKIVIECDKHFGGFMLAFVSILFIGFIVLIVMISK